MNEFKRLTEEEIKRMYEGKSGNYWASSLAKALEDAYGEINRLNGILCEYDTNVETENMGIALARIMELEAENAIFRKALGDILDGQCICGSAMGIAEQSLEGHEQPNA